MSEWNDAIEQSAKSLCERATELRDEIRMGKIEGRAAGAIVYELEICASIIRRLKRPADQDGWLPIKSAPKDRPLLAWCDHKANPYVEDEKSGRLTVYGAHAEGLNHAFDGFNIVVWGGGFDDRTHEYPNEAHLPDWWFVADSEFEVVANPVYWRPLPPAPTPEAK